MAARRVGEEVGQERVQAVHDAPQVDPQHPLPVGQGEVGDVAAPTDAGVVAEQVDPAEARHHGVGEGLHRRRVAHVGHDAGDPELGGGGLESTGLDVGDHHGHALASQARRQRPADAAGPARDDRNPTRDALHGGDQAAVWSSKNVAASTILDTGRTVYCVATGKTVVPRRTSPIRFRRSVALLSARPAGSLLRERLSVPLQDSLRG